MARTVEITVPPERTDAVLADARPTEGVLGVRVQRGASERPSGDVITLLVTNRSLPGLLRRLEQQGRLAGGGWSITLSEPAGLLNPDNGKQIDGDTNEVVWEEMDFTILRDSTMTRNALVVMTTAGVLAAVGLSQGALHLVIAGMVIAPGFEPIVRIALAVVGKTGDWLHGVVDTLKAYAALLLGALLGGAALLLAGTPLLANGEPYLDAPLLIDFWTSFTLPGLVVTLFAGTSGAILIATNRSVLTAGVMIGLALIPPPAIAALALLAGEPAVAGAAALRWLVEALVVLVAALGVYLWKRTLVHRRVAVQPSPRP
jgi:hypothetical protein